MRWPGNTQLVLGEILAPGDLLGGYRIVSQSGSGETRRQPRGLATAAVLYNAVDVSSDLPVILTVFKGEHSPDEPFAQRLVRDSKRVASFMHPNVVAVYEAGLELGRLYLVTQAIDGDTLRERIVGGGIPAAQTLALLAPIADALDAAHAAGLVHGELTPDAVRVDAAGTPHLAAFNVPVRVSGGRVDGVRLGDICYASPELLGGRELTAASDIYSLSAVLCRCFTGELHVPEQTESRAERLQAWGRRTQPLRPGVPALADVIARGMAKQPADRYEQARALIEDAAKAVASASWGPSRSSPEPVAPWRRVVFGLVCAGVIAAGVLELETRSNTGPVTVPRQAERVQSVSDGPLGIRYRRPWRPAPGAVPGAVAVVGSLTDLALAAALNQDLAPLDAARGLGDGPLPARAAAARHLARLAIAASPLLARLAPPARSAQATLALRRALSAQAVALNDLAAAALGNERGAYVRARERDLSDRLALRLALRSLAAEGLHPPALDALDAVPPAPPPAASASPSAASGQTAAAPTSEVQSPAGVSAPPPAVSAPRVVPTPAPTSSSSGPPSPTVIVVPTGSGASKQTATSPPTVVVVPTS